MFDIICSIWLTVITCKLYQLFIQVTQYISDNTCTSSINKSQNEHDLGRLRADMENVEKRLEKLENRSCPREKQPYSHTQNVVTSNLCRMHNISPDAAAKLSDYADSFANEMFDPAKN